MITKARKIANAKVDANKAYSLKEASTLVKEINTTKFDSSVDIHVRLGVDPKKADQAIRGTVSLLGSGCVRRIANRVYCFYGNDCKGCRFYRFHQAV